MRQQVSIPDSSTHEWLSLWIWFLPKAREWLQYIQKKLPPYTVLQIVKNEYSTHFLKFHSTPVQSSSCKGLNLYRILKNCGTSNRNQMNYCPIYFNSMRNQSNPRFATIWTRLLSCLPWLDGVYFKMKDTQRISKVSLTRNWVRLYSRREENFRPQRNLTTFSKLVHEQKLEFDHISNPRNMFNDKFYM